MIELGIDGHWIRGRIIWTAQGIRNTLVAGLELAESGVIATLLGADEPRVALAS